MKFYLVSFIAILVVCFVKCKSDVSQLSKTSLVESGDTLSKRYCASCHLYPEPDQLDKNTWHQFVLPRMAAFMGIYTDGRRYYDSMPDQWMEPGSGGQRVRNAKVYPEKAIISREEWKKIFDYYVSSAPAQLPKQDNTKEITIGIPSFKTRPFLNKAHVSPLIQSITFDSVTSRICLAEMEGGVFIYSASGRLLNTFGGKRFIVDMKIRESNLFALDMGTRIASDNPQGSYLRFNLENKKVKEELLKSGLMRPVDIVEGQLDDDLDLELVICEYGNLLGQLAIYDSQGNSQNVVVLNKDDGYASVELEDMNHDGKLDIVAVQGNGDEGIDIFWNEGELKFRRERILRFQPTSGSTDMNLVDFNKDGKMDILYCSGDNGDYTPINKPYHGIYIYLSSGSTYKEAMFLPMNGVYQAEAVDFDQDGDLDIAAVAFHPDFLESTKSSFVYFKNEGNKFSAFTVSEYNYSRWMRFLVADIDGDKDQDILLSAMNIKTPDVPSATADIWLANDLPVLLIENQIIN